MFNGLREFGNKTHAPAIFNPFYALFLEKENPLAPALKILKKPTSSPTHPPKNHRQSIIQFRCSTTLSPTLSNSSSLQSSLILLNKYLTHIFFFFLFKQIVHYTFYLKRPVSINPLSTQFSLSFNQTLTNTYFTRLQPMIYLFSGGADSKAWHFESTKHTRTICLFLH